MNDKDDTLRIIGRAENVSFPEFNLRAVPARIDTGARTSALWASDVREENGRLSFVFFGEGSPLYTGQPVTVDTYEELMVASSNGMTEKRFKIKLLIKIKGRKIRASFTLANRASQVYPILVGRNVLLGKFVVDVKKGHTLIQEEQARTAALRSKLEEEKL
jgi:hypothetical protein